MSKILQYKYFKEQKNRTGKGDTAWYTVQINIFAKHLNLMRRMASLTPIDFRSLIKL